MAEKNIYYDINNPPLLLQGFDFQAVQIALPRSQRQFTTEVNRGVVSRVDYQTTNTANILGLDESFWCDADITLTAGGQEILREVPAETFDNFFNAGYKRRQPIKVWLNGGQVLESTLNLDPATLSTVPVLSAQLQIYYSTLELEKWRAKFRFKNGNALKRKGYKISLSNVPGIQTLEDVVPKNQGKIIGFSIFFLGLNNADTFATLSMNGLEVIKDVSCQRFSRQNQRAPEIFLIPFLPGSKFKFVLNKSAAVSNPGAAFVTFYFDN